MKKDKELETKKDEPIKPKPESFGSSNGVNMETLLNSGDSPFGWDQKTMGLYDKEGGKWSEGTP